MPLGPAGATPAFGAVPPALAPQSFAPAVPMPAALPLPAAVPVPVPAPAATGAAWRVERIVRPAQLERLAAEWSELLAASRSDCLFLTPEWLLAWWRHLRDGRRPALYAVRGEGGRLAALAPFAAVRSPHLLPPQRLAFPGTATVGADYLDVVVRTGDEEALEALADQLDRDRPLLELERVPREGSAAARLADLLERRGWQRLERVTDVCPWIDLEGVSWDGYVAGLGSSHRANLRRRLRKLHERFEVRLERVATEAALDRALDALLDLHERRWSGRGGSDALGGPAVVGFHREIARAALGRGWLRLYVLHLDGRPAAALYGFLRGDRFLFYQSGFDPDFADLSVGLVIMGLAIREAIAEGAREYDLLHGDEPYKFLWAGRSRELARIELYPPTLAAELRRRVRAPLRAARRALAPRLKPLVAALLGRTGPGRTGLGRTGPGRTGALPPAGGRRG